MVKIPPGLRERLVQPFLITNVPVNAVAWGAAMGMLTGLLPLFGVQLYVATGLWLAARWAFGRPFSMPVCFAVSWVMNPLTVVPIYYTYYLSGDAVWEWITVPTPDWTFKEFEDLFVAAVRPSGGVWWERLLGGMVVILQYFGWPVVLGSILWSVPLSAATYFVARTTVLRYRRRLVPGASGPGGKDRRHPAPDTV